MIIPTLYFMVLALIPIVVLESIYISIQLRIPFSRTVASVAVGNIVSTIVGIPLTWGLLFLVQIVTGGASSYQVQGFAGKVLSVTLQAPWLLPFDPEEFWIFHAAALFLLVPFFFATWMIEYVIARNKLASEIVACRNTIELYAAERMVRSAVRNSNLTSYGLIALVLVISLLLSGRSRF